MHRMIFVVDTWIAVVFGIGLLVAPQVFFLVYGIHTDASGEFLARLVGVFVFGQAPLLWWARDHVATPAGIAITRGHGIMDTLGTVLCAMACLGGVMNAQGWGIVVLFALFGAGRIYYGFIARPAPAMA